MSKRKVKLDRSFTLDVGVTSAMPDESVGGLQNIVHAYAESNLGHDLDRIRKCKFLILNSPDLVGVLLIEFVLNFIAVLLVELIWWDLHQIGERRLSLLMCASITSHLDLLA